MQSNNAPKIDTDKTQNVLSDENSSTFSGHRQGDKIEKRNHRREKRPLPSPLFRLTFTARVLEKIHSENFIFYGNSK
jgi:hypothetical protein